MIQRMRQLLAGVPDRARSGWGIGLGIAGLAWLVCFRGALDPGRRLAFRDVSHFYLPLYEYLRTRMAEDGLPLWNPLWNTGVPIVGEATSALFYPPRLLFLLPVTTATLLVVYVLLHLAIAAVGAAWAARRAGAGTAGQALAAVLYGCAGPVLFQYSNPIFLVGAAWLPWILAGLREAALAPSPRAIALAAAALALPILGGDPQAAFHGAFLAGLWWAVRACRRGRRGPIEGREPRWAPLAAAIALAGGAALIQIWPTAAWSAGSERSLASPPGITRLIRPAPSDAPPWWQRPEPESYAEQVYQFSVAPWQVAGMLVPNLFGFDRPAVQRVSLLFDPGEENWPMSLYLGAPAALALLAAFRRRRPGFWTGVGLFALLACFGRYGGGALYGLIAGPAGAPDGGLDPAIGGLYWWLVTLVPGYGSFRFPGKWSVLVALGLALAAARALDGGRESSEASQSMERTLRRLGGFSWAAAILGIVGCASLVLARASGWRPDWLTARLEAGVGNTTYGAFDLEGFLLHAAVSFGQLAVVALGLVWLVRRRARAGVGAHVPFVLGVALLSAADLAFASANGRWIESVTRSIDQVLPSELGAPALVPEQRRLQLDDRQWFDPARVVTDADVRMAEVERTERNSLSGAHNLSAGEPLLNGSATIGPATFSELWVRILPNALQGTPEQQARVVPALLAWLSVDGIRHRGPMETFTVEGTTLEVPTYLTTPVARGKPTVRACTSWRLLEGRDRDAPFPSVVADSAVGRGPDVEWVRPDERPVPAPESTESAEVPVRVLAQGSQWLRAELVASARTLVYAQVFQDGNWRATIEPLEGTPGTPRTVRPWVTNCIGQGVIVEPGHWRIVLRYRPSWLPAGAAISALGWALIGVLLSRGPKPPVGGSEGPDPAPSMA